MVASTARGWGCCVISGRMASVFNSRPAHAISQCELETVIAVPTASADTRVAKMKGLISKGGGLTFIFGVWAR